MRSRSLKALRFKLRRSRNFPSEARKMMETTRDTRTSMKARNLSLHYLKRTKMRLGSSKIILSWVRKRRQQSQDQQTGKYHKYHLWRIYHLWRRISLSSWLPKRIIVALRVEMWRSRPNIRPHKIIDINSRSKSGNKSSLRYYNQTSSSLMPCHNISLMQPSQHHTHRCQLTLT